jgi:hypothetical protein
MAFLPFVPQLILGAAQTGIALSQLNKLRGQALPRYDFSPTQANVSMYKQRLAEGLPPAEIAAMQQTQAAQNAGGYRQATELAGGQLSSAIGRIGQIQNINLATRMGQMQAQERRAAQSGLAASQSALQGQMNMQTQYDMQRRAQEEQALGNAMKAGLQSMGNSLTFGAFDYLGGLNKTKTTPEIATVTEQSMANVTPTQFANQGQFPMTSSDYFNMGTPFNTRTGENAFYAPDYQASTPMNTYGFAPGAPTLSRNPYQVNTPFSFMSGYVPPSIAVKK